MYRPRAAAERERAEAQRRANRQLNAPAGFVARLQRTSIAYTLPVRALVWADAAWMIPRTLACILDQRDERESGLQAAEQHCDGCGALSPDGSRRTPTATGWRIICPACAASSLRRYRREL
ncbi:hypothetical protein GCM10010350_78430 [Streptomyces galilaeus]|nr:hypothetical protein GCM10010350_78430 [Streptomyces galilaeus]